MLDEKYFPYRIFRAARGGILVVKNAFTHFRCSPLVHTSYLLVLTITLICAVDCELDPYNIPSVRLSYVIHTFTYVNFTHGNCANEKRAVRV